ncbi:substrate-binding periplasmic protein [Bdellovibrio sp.]|uniref:substrate-binding periplasmic protein n=1 Tax=Bdellovibrio sp. TaxID=28201 RepID=UPI0039E53705
MKALLRHLCFVVICGTSIGTPPVQAATLSFRSDYWCPYVCEPNSSRPGYMVEVLQKIFQKHGHTVDVKLTNWVRAIKETRTGKAQGLLGARRADAPDFIFSEKSLGITKNVYFTHKDSSWTYQGRQSLQAARIGVINGYSYGDSIDHLIQTRHKSFIPFSGERPLEQVIKMLESGRLDAFIENPLALHYALKNQNLPTETLKVAGWVSAQDPFLFIGFTPNNPESKTYATIVTKGIQELRRNGNLKRILDKYNLEDWENSQPLALGALHDFSPRLLKSPLDLLHMFNTGSL